MQQIMLMVIKWSSLQSEHQLIDLLAEGWNLYSNALQANRPANVNAK
jgi:hypothetical protein